MTFKYFYVHVDIRHRCNYMPPYDQRHDHRLLRTRPWIEVVPEFVTEST